MAILDKITNSMHLKSKTLGTIKTIFITILILMILTSTSLWTPEAVAIAIEQESYKMVLTSFNKKSVTLKLGRKKAQFSTQLIEFKRLTGTKQAIKLPKELCHKSFSKKLCRKARIK